MGSATTIYGVLEVGERVMLVPRASGPGFCTAVLAVLDQLEGELKFRTDSFRGSPNPSRYSPRRTSAYIRRSLCRML
jgi:hypothetical protein